MGTSSAGRPETGAKLKAAKKPLFLYFTDLSESDLERIGAAESKAQTKQLLKECLQIDEAKGFKTEILADMHYHNYTFCLSREFVPAKTSTFLSIMKAVLDEAVSKRLEAEGAFDVCKELLLKHGVERPPWSVGIFSFDDVKAIMEYVHHTFFRHYRLYMYAFMTHCDLSFCVDHPSGNVAPPTARILTLTLQDEVDPRTQPELAHLFKPSEAELAEAEMRKLRGEISPEEKAAQIKKKVDEGVQKLMDSFEERLRAQDEKFQAMLDSS